MEGLRKKLLGDDLRRQSQGIPFDYDPSMPWDKVFNMACEDDTWWREQVEEPCLRVKMKASPIAQPLGDDASTSHTVEPPWKRQRTNLRFEEQATENTCSITPKRIIKQHNVSNGLYTTNRQGVTLCMAFQDGACTQRGSDNRCAAVPTRTHQCAKCLCITHGAATCNQIPKAPGEMTGTLTRYKGQGKGKTGRKSSKP